jgi:hypothetical protein
MCIWTGLFPCDVSAILISLLIHIPVFWRNLFHKLITQGCSHKCPVILPCKVMSYSMPVTKAKFRLGSSEVGGCRLILTAGSYRVQTWYRLPNLLPKQLFLNHLERYPHADLAVTARSCSYASHLQWFQPTSKHNTVIHSSMPRTWHKHKHVTRRQVISLTRTEFKKDSYDNWGLEWFSLLNILLHLQILTEHVYARNKEH